MTDVHTGNILIVGESESTERYVRAALADGAFSCRCTERIDEACEAALAHDLEAIIVDCATLDAEMVTRLLAWMHRSVSDLPIVLIAAAGRGIADALSFGVVDILRSPAPADELLAAVGRAVQWHRETRREHATSQRSVREMTARSEALVRTSVETGIESAGALQAWLSSVYRRDDWTADHVRRVADLAVLIGAMMGVSSDDIAHIERAALLHDVGRLAVPDRLMRKPGPLTDDERTLIRTHVQVAYEIAAASPFLEPVAETLFAVRERFDGTGYPLGLRGEAIPLPARIIAVAEGLDTLGSVGGGEPASVDTVNAALVRAAGACFDPAVVRAWLRCVDRGMVASATGRDGSEGW